MRAMLSVFCAALTFLPLARALAVAPVVAPQDDLERLRRDQDEILRKAERLQELMSKLRQRYEREGRTKEVELLQQGLQHLEASGLVRDVAGIRDDLTAQALSEALRKQTEVIDNLERLLNILLERRSMESLQQEIQRTEEMARTARDLERAQRELRDETREALRSEPSATEAQLLERLQELRVEQTSEARNNLREAGGRRPFLEDALRRVQELLGRQEALEQRGEAELSGQPSPVQQRLFDLGELTQRTRELIAAVRDQAWAEHLQQDAQELQKALQSGDTSAVQGARDRLRARTASAPNQQQSGEPVRDAEAEALTKELRTAENSDTEAGREALQRAARRAAELAQRRQTEGRQQNRSTTGQLAQDAQRTGEALAEGSEPQAGSPAESTQKAAEDLARAERAMAGTEQAQPVQEALSSALRNLEQARARLQRDNPDSPTEAGRMATEAERVARDLRNAPEAEATEQQAAEAMKAAEEALRNAGRDLEQARERPAAAQGARSAMQGSRQAMERAQQTLQEALAESNPERTGDMQAAAERQEQLRQQTEQLQKDMQQAGQAGAITQEQQRAAGERMQQASSAMQRAEQQLGQGRQATAATEQQQAAEQLQQAQQAMEQNRPLNAQQQEAMQQMAKRQQQLQEDIVRLAQEARERENREATRALDQAAQAAQRAQRALEEGEAQEALEQQEQARQKLEEAADALQEERDRYEDLRQEELLFRMAQELTQLLEKQRPITAGTLETQQSAGGNLSRPARRRLNQFGEQEQALAGRVEFMVKALAEEGNLVFRTVLKANQDDLTEIGRRLSGRNPDPGSFTTMLQQDVERRTEDLLAALERERQRREQQRREQEQGQNAPGENRFNPQQQRLVSLIADLQMLRQLEVDTKRQMTDFQALVELRGDDTIADTEAALLERLAHRHGEITTLFLQFKTTMEQMLQEMQGQQGNQDPNDGQPGRGRGR